MPTPDWPDPPLLTHLLLENPWPLVVCLAAVAVAMWLVGGRAGRGRIQIAAGIPLVLGAGVVILALQIETDREALKQRTQRLTRAVTSPMAHAALAKLLSEDVRFFDLNRARIMNLLRRIEQRYEIQEHHITSLKAFARSPRYGRTRLRILTNVQGPIRTALVRSTWRLSWRRSPGGPWRLVRIQWLTLNGRPVNRRMLP